MEQTPAHERHNPDLLRAMPTTAARIIEVGCSCGALAREYKKLNASCRYTGIEIVPGYADLARRYCDDVLDLDVEGLGDQRLADLQADCWVFGDSLEHLRDPWRLLRRIRSASPADGIIVACIPNAQHWSVQVRLSSGQLRYEESGLLDRTHLRWFTRITILELFREAGYTVMTCQPRVFNEPQRDQFLSAIAAMACCAGVDVQQALSDATAYQYVVRAVALR